MADTFKCSVVTPAKVVFEGDVSYASVPAWDGQVGVAAQRAPMLVKLGDGMLRLDEPGGSRERYFLGGGFAQMKDNRLMLLSGEAIGAHEVDPDETRTTLAESESVETATVDDVDKRRRAIHRAKTLLQMANHAE